MNIKKNILIWMLVIVIALIFFVPITRWSTTQETHKHSIEQIDGNIKTVIELTAGATAASAALSFLPDDQCTPIATEIAELAKYFLVVLSALYLEKYMVTIVGYASFKILIPAACIFWGIGFSIKKNEWQHFAYKIVLCALAIYLIIPTSVKMSDIIYSSYEKNIQDTINSAAAIEDSANSFDTSGNIVSWITEKAKDIKDFSTGLISELIEVLAIMIVTSCLIPILVLIFYMWIIKMITGVDLGTRIRIPGRK